MGYRFPDWTRRAPRYRDRTPQSAGLPDIPLFGTVGNKPASEEEERITNSLQKNSNVSGFIFQWRVPTDKSLPAHDKIIDWLVFSRGKKHALEFFGKVGHGLNILQEAKDRDRVNDLNETFERIGVEPLVPERTILFWWQNPQNIQYTWDRIIKSVF